MQLGNLSQTPATGFTWAGAATEIAKALPGIATTVAQYQILSAQEKTKRAQIQASQTPTYGLPLPGLFAGAGYPVQPSPYTLPAQYGSPGIVQQLPRMDWTTIAMLGLGGLALLMLLQRRR